LFNSLQYIVFGSLRILSIKRQQKNKKYFSCCTNDNENNLSIHKYIEISKKMFACFSTIYTFFDYDDKIEFIEEFEHTFSKYQFNKYFNYDKICEQIIRYGNMLLKNLPRSYFNHYEKIYWDDNINWIPVPNLKPNME
jgi:hypothetical protein